MPQCESLLISSFRPHSVLSLFRLHCELHCSLARRLGYKNPDTIFLKDFISESSTLLVAEAALVEAGPSFLSSNFCEASIFVEKAAECMTQAVRRDNALQHSRLTLMEQIKRWESLDGLSEYHASSDDLWNLVRKSLIMAYSSGRDQIMRLIALFVCSCQKGTEPSAAFSLGLLKSDIELSVLSLIHIASFSDSFKDESRAQAAVLSRLTFISENATTAQDFASELFGSSVSFALCVLEKMPQSLQFLDNFFWFVLAYFPLKHEKQKQIMLKIIHAQFGQKERACIDFIESTNHVSAAAVLELISDRYSNFDENLYRFFANFWSVVFCFLEGAFVERNLLSALSSFESDAARSAPLFMREAFYRLRLILQTSCRIQQLRCHFEKQSAQLMFDDADFESIPLHLQVGLLVCRGMMILHNPIVFSNENADPDALDKAALHFFDRAEQVARLVTPRVVRIGILFAKSFIAFRRCKYFGDELLLASTSTATCVVEQQLLCFVEGLKYLKSLCKCVKYRNSICTINAQLASIFFYVTFLQVA